MLSDTIRDVLRVAAYKSLLNKTITAQEYTEFLKDLDKQLI